MFESVGNGMERYMSLLSARQKIVASNIANADTPGYKTKDIDFQAEYQSAIGAGIPSMQEVEGLKVNNDGNNVSIDRESRLLAENALRFNIAAQLVKNEIKDIQAAIQGGTSA